MPVQTSKSPPIITIGGADFAPPDGSLDRVGPRDREDYWRQVAKESHDAVIRQINSGTDIHGNKPKRRRPRKDGATGRFFSPHWSLSRVQTQIRYFQRAGREAVVYWLKPWGRIVAYWAAGVRGRVYDVVGLTRDAQERIKHRVWQWWSAKVAKGRLGLAGVTMVGPAPGQSAPTGPIAYHQAFGPGPLPARPAYFARFAPPPKPAIEPAPVLRANLPAFAVVQAIQPIYEAAGTRRTSLGQIHATVNRLSSRPAGVLSEVAWRLGVTPAPTGKAKALRAIREVLEDRWRTGRAGGQGPRPEPPKPPRPAPVPVAPPPPPAAAKPPARFKTWEDARDWARANLQTPVRMTGLVSKGTLGYVREGMAALAEVEHRTGASLPVESVTFGSPPNQANGVVIYNVESGKSRMTLQTEFSRPFAEIKVAANRKWMAEQGGEVPFSAAPSYRALVWHESAHALDYATPNTLRGPGHEVPYGGLSSWLRRRLADDEARKISGYAMSDWWGLRPGYEAWAEAVAMVATDDPRAKSLPPDVVAYIRGVIEGGKAR